jgi:hypothetical protein
MTGPSAGDLGRLVALLRWELPPEEHMSQDPLLAALIVEYGTTLERLQRSFKVVLSRIADALGYDLV